jgi:hypothetical protein
VSRSVLVPMFIVLVGCAPTTTNRPVAGQCPVDAAQTVLVERGAVPVVITATHSGDEAPSGCAPGDRTERGIVARRCDPQLDEVCESGPCRAGGADVNSRRLVDELVVALGACLGGRPSLVLTEVSRRLVDTNRDANDPGGPRCAMEDDAALMHWEAFHHVVEEAVADAVTDAGARALLLDVHTYGSLTAAPPPAVMLGAGTPFGTTLPHLSSEDPQLELIFGQHGLKQRLEIGLGGRFPTTRVYPESMTSSLEGLFAGRYVVHRYARTLGDSTASLPRIDALQIEVSSQLRDDPEWAAQQIAAAICSSSFGRRLRGIEK